MNWKQMVAGAALLGCALMPALGQIIPRDAAVPVEVRHAKGEFAKRMHGAVMPTGKGWKAATDGEKRVQIMVPSNWKVDPAPEEAIIRAVPPGHEKDPKAVLLVLFNIPRDADPLEVDEEFAQGYVEDLAEDPMLKKVQFKATDSGYVLARGQKFALAGGTMGYGGEFTFQQEQLVFISEDRIVTIQFTATAAEYAKHADQVAKIFASYQTLGMRKISSD
jgi:hypothetical protein